MINLAEPHADIPSLTFECIAVAPPCTCIVAPLVTKIPSPELSWNTQLLNVADVKLPPTTAPYPLLANSQRVATRVVSEEIPILDITSSVGKMEEKIHAL